MKYFKKGKELLCKILRCSVVKAETKDNILEHNCNFCDNTYTSQEIDNILTFLLHNARSTSNANKAGEEGRKTAIEDGATLDTINGISIQYSVEYDNFLIYIFKKSGNRNKGYSYRIKKEDLNGWIKLIKEARYRFKKNVSSEQTINGEVKYKTNIVKPPKVFI